MLARILDTLRKSEGVLDLRQLGRELGMEESALRGMMDYMARKGYLKKEYCSGQSCEGCHRGCLSAGSSHSPDGEKRPMGYALTEKVLGHGRKL